MAVYTVSQVTGYLKEALESDPLLGDLNVVGEVSNLRVSGAGHSYFTLKDQQNVLNSVMFRGQPGADLLANGTSVSTHGRITFYEPRGSTDFMVDLAMPEGVGELALEFERLSLRLEAEGLFEITRKRPLPQFPRVVGVVTSPAGAVFHDIQNVIRRRYPLVELILAPTTVQGTDASAKIVAAIERLNREGRAEVIIVARGGGSLEDLWPFNEEIVARAVYASRTPVVSGVGHETDNTIIDRVADVRAPTPSAAAELVVPDATRLKAQLEEIAGGSRRSLAYQLDSLRAQVTGHVRRLEVGLPDIGNWRRRVDDLARTGHNLLTGRLSQDRLRVEGLSYRVTSLDPVAPLRRGFAVVQKAATQEVVSSTAQVLAGDLLTITVSDGSIPATAGPGVKPKTATKETAKKRKSTAQPAGMERLI
ncbi:MAG: exodeoxyribonuclease VII large subunit [SAR202 cluster bacterium Io17-Chloro-G9]|nr:MAG: exodeoxyribonuclease VII large subunit [SAR202 cluster bacterium Io17-Chloro-G9]